MLKFALFALCFSIPALADSTSAQPITFADSIGTWPTYTGMFDFAAWGHATFPYIGPYQGTTPTTFSYSWDRRFQLPASPTGDYFEVTRINTIEVDGAIVIDGQSFDGDGVQVMDLVPAPYPDPDLYKAHPYYPNQIDTERMDLTGPIDIHVYGSYKNSYDWYGCCRVSQTRPDTNGFEQWVQIERFYADGTPDPFAPEPASFGLVALAFLPVGWMLRRRSRSATR